MFVENKKKTHTQSVADSLVVVLLTSYYAMTFILSSVTWGRFVLIGLALLIFLVYLTKNKGVIRLQFHSLHAILLIFTAYTLMSSLWALSPALSAEKALSLMELLLIFSVMFL